MIYLDTSAFIKLYLNEEGSAQVHRLVVAQEEPLPIWSLTELEFHNALRFKVFLQEMASADVDRLVSLYLGRKGGGQYHTPRLDPVALHALSLDMTARTPDIGCRSLDILHVAAARLIGAGLFVTADRRQRELARTEGLDARLV